ncbi:MAG: hypothetical protein ACI4WS_11330 [Oscillospiraceae bacterium]
MNVIKRITTALAAAVLACSMTVPAFAEAAEVQREVVYQELQAKSSKVKISTLSFSEVSSRVYTGKTIKPAVTVKNGSVKLVSGTDYTVSYKNNKSIGTSTITITGKGNYTGTKRISFKIIPGTTSVSVKNSDGKLNLSWNKVTGADGYQINYSTDGKSFKTLATVSANSYSTSKLGAGNYQFKVRAYKKVNGKTYYGGFSSNVKMNIKEKAVVNEKISYMVWVPTNGGTKYHSTSSCSNMKAPRYVSIEIAIAEGFTACKRCH